MSDITDLRDELNAINAVVADIKAKADTIVTLVQGLEAGQDLTEVKAAADALKTSTDAIDAEVGGIK